jgi:hypothetical protein
MHVTEEPQDAALVKLDEFLGEPDSIEVKIAKIDPSKHIARNSQNVVLNQGVLVTKEGNPVGR